MKRRIVLTSIIALLMLLAMVTLITVAFYEAAGYLGPLGIVGTWLLMAITMVAAAWRMGKSVQVPLTRRAMIGNGLAAPLCWIWYPTAGVLIVGLGLD